METFSSLDDILLMVSALDMEGDTHENACDYHECSEPPGLALAGYMEMKTGVYSDEHTDLYTRFNQSQSSLL